MIAPPQSIGRRRVLAGAGAMLALTAGRAKAGRPLTLIVPGAAGSQADRAARAFAPFLERHLRHAVVWVANHPADGGVAGLRALAQAEPSGETIGFLSTPALAARCVDRPGTGDLLASLRLVGAMAKEPIAFVAGADSPLTSVQDLVRRSAEDAAALPLGTPPAGSAPHLAALRLQALARTPLNIVAFPSAAAARQAALAGNVAAASLALGDALEGLRAARLSGLGVAAEERTSAFPDIAPLGDSGLAFSAFVRRGLGLPAGASDAVRDALADALRDVVADPEFIAQAESDGFTGTWIDATAWTRQVDEERAEFGRLWTDAPWTVSGLG